MPKRPTKTETATKKPVTSKTKPATATATAPEQKSTTSARPKKPRRQQVPTYCSYDFEIEDWKVTYSISVGDDRRFSRGPYSEHVFLELTTRMVEPTKFKDRRVRFDLIGERKIDIEIDTDDTRRGPALHMGTLHMRGDQSYFLGVLPQTAAWGLVPALEAGRIKVIHMYGEPLHHGSASIRYLHFDRDFGEQ